MFKDGSVIFLYAETPLHAGGGEGSAGIDLPIQREKHTQYPLIQPGGVKGALRDLAEGLLADVRRELADLRQKSARGLNGDAQKKQETLIAELQAGMSRIVVAFGPDREGASDHGGALSFGEARLLLFPVRSVAGVFAWVTCPMVLDRFRRDLDWMVRVGQAPAPPTPIQTLLGLAELRPGGDEALVSSDPLVVTSEEEVVLEDVAFRADRCHADAITAFAGWLARIAFPSSEPVYKPWQERLPGALVILHDDAYGGFVRYSTEVASRIAIGERGTVEERALWTEEHLPTDSLLYSIALATDPKGRNSDLRDAGAVMNFLERQVISRMPVAQFGGNETVGRGIVRMTLRRAAALQTAAGGNP